MIQTQKWLRYAVFGSMAIGVVGFVNVCQANGAGGFALTKLQHPYHESEWRQSHPHWNGRLYWHNKGYYYDRTYATPAIVDHEYTAIGGGVVVNTDPYVTFSGNYGTYYPYASLSVDLASSDPVRHTRALYFQHPYFWRSGVRYDRTVVTRGGKQFYRFARHRY
jgi:hypothetical protein